jgi:hypothetical protein
MSDDSIEPGELLWIDPRICRIPHQPDGFVLRVVEVLPCSSDDHRRPLVWVRGPLLDEHGLPCKILTLRVPVDQPRVRPAYGGPRTPTVRGGRHRPATMIGPPPGYTRRQIS